MATPVLIEEDVQQMNAVLGDFLSKSEAEAALLTAEGGFVIAHLAKSPGFDVSTLGALAANAGYATQAIAQLIGEPGFEAFYQQGQKHSLFVSIVDPSHSLIVLFAAHLSAGAVQHYTAGAIQLLAEQLQKARERAPGEGIDPISLNLTDTTQLFKRKLSPGA